MGGREETLQCLFLAWEGGWPGGRSPRDEPGRGRVQLDGLGLFCPQTVLLFGAGEGWKPWGVPGVIAPVWSEWPIPLPRICVLVCVSKSSSGGENPGAAGSSPSVSGDGAEQLMLLEGLSVRAWCCPAPGTWCGRACGCPADLSCLGAVPCLSVCRSVG